MSNQKTIITHHAPDLDAITGVWLLKKFDSQHFANAKIFFVNPGQKLDNSQASHLGINPHDITYVDTGLGEFDHHQPDRAQQKISATSLVFDYICQLHPEYCQDQALQILVKYVTDIDHFEEIFWPETQTERSNFILSELIHGLEHLEYHNDDSMMNFGFTCLDSVYQNLKMFIKAKKIIDQKAQIFNIKVGKVLAATTSNDEVIKIAQKMGFVLAIRKDPKEGNIRIKARPDADLNLKKLYRAISNIDTEGSWFYHPGGKMLLNGSSKTSQTASPLSLKQIVDLVLQLYS